MTISLDRNKCIKCHKCIEACQGLVLNATPNGFPEMKIKNETFCIKCGNCEIACPKNALRIQDAGTYPNTDYTDIGHLHFAELAKHLLTRRSVRKFKQRMVDRKTVENILDIIRYAPSSSNLQPVRWVVIYDTKKLENLKKIIIAHKIADFANIREDTPQARSIKRFIAAENQKKDVLCWNAPHMLLGVVPKTLPNAVADSIIATEWFDILAPAYGIATCWTDLFSLAVNEYIDIKKVLGLSNLEICRCSMAFGYPQEKNGKLPPRKPLRAKWI